MVKGDLPLSHVPHGRRACCSWAEGKPKDWRLHTSFANETSCQEESTLKRKKPLGEKQHRTLSEAKGPSSGSYACLESRSDAFIHGLWVCQVQKEADHISRFDTLDFRAFNARMPSALKMVFTLPV